MSTVISGPQHVRPVEPLTTASASPSTAAFGFADVLRSAVDRVSASEADAGSKVEAFLTGSETDLHSVAIAGQKASLEFDMLLQVRNKVVQAYSEVMRLQL